MFRPGKVLRVTFGANPNSSSLGVDVTFLLFGSAAAAVVAVLLSAVLRRPKAGATVPPADA